MTMILKKDFTSFNHRLFVVPVSVRAISFKSSPSGELSYYRTKWASPLQLPIPLTHEGLAHFERRCAAALAAFLCASCASSGGFLYHRKVRGLSYDIKKDRYMVTFSCPYTCPLSIQPDILSLPEVDPIHLIPVFV